MRRLPTFLAFGFIVITLFRVGTFAAEAMRAGVLGWIFSVFLGLAVYGFAYWTRVSAMARDGSEDLRSQMVRRMAWTGLILFILADGFFNVTEVWRSVNPATTWDQIASGIYGAFPTLAAALLGALQGFVDRIPKPPVSQKYSILAALRAKIVIVLGGYPQPAEISQPRPQVFAEISQVPQPAIAAKLPAKSYECQAAGCEYATDNQRSYAAHMKKHHRESVDA